MCGEMIREGHVLQRGGESGRRGRTSARRPGGVQEGGRAAAPVEGELALRVPAGQQASHARGDTAVPLHEPVALLVVALKRGTAGEVRRDGAGFCFFLQNVEL